ncbi:ABC transporter ATP-binding protein [Paenibacillus crassostreae]|uniref:ABC transporter ATP-binding protein n=2 Tax=Paenibacillus crassostreae TaxID=1763538 RepID=A0A167G5Z6_9BACL|nr:ABC transporter ATP-binding protein [Paenibacillus crassostreae]OAB77243.1 ABC transporter ATP-binding protein [Paenibacillus crassostreae]
MVGSYLFTESEELIAIFSLHDLNFSFTQTCSTPLIQGLSMDVRAGEFVSLIGISGSGKSTLLKLIAGLLAPLSGDIRIHGEKVQYRLGKAAYMPQKDLLLPWRTVLDNCLLPWELNQQPNRGDKKDFITKIQVALKQFGLDNHEQSYPNELSGGMRQRVALLRTLLTGQDLLLLDEPFGSLDAMTKREMHRWLLEIWEDLKKTVLFITHDLEEAILLSDRIYIMAKDSTQGVEEIIVDLPRPRHYEMNYNPQFIQLRRDLERQLHEKTTF